MKGKEAETAIYLDLYLHRDVWSISDIIEISKEFQAEFDALKG